MSQQLSAGIAGLPNVGKSTLFNALLKKQVAVSANYPFTTIEPNVGVVEVPDKRLQQLAQMVANESSKSQAPNSKQAQSSNYKNEDKVNWPPIIPAVVRFVDIAGLVKGAAQGEGLGNQFLSHIREVDVIVFVLRDFKNEDVIRSGSVDAKEDLEVLKTELMLKDLEVIEKQSLRSSPAAPDAGLKRIGVRDNRAEVLQKAKQLVQEGKWLEENLDGEELEKIKELQLLSTKKSICVLNTDEDNLSVIASPSADGRGNDNYVRICAKMEEDLASLDPEEQKQFLAELGVSEPGLNTLIRKAYEALGLITFFTAGPKEVHAWTTKAGTLAPQAAGVIHTDFERGFIAAEVVDWKILVDAGGWQAAKVKGLVKTIGKSDEVVDGQVVEFRFSV